MLLYILLFVEVVLRIVLEIRERRATQLRGGVFAFLRIIPLVNDIVPLPENRKKPLERYLQRSTKKGIRHCTMLSCVIYSK